MMNKILFISGLLILSVGPQTAFCQSAPANTQQEEKPPYYEEIMVLVNSLEYSGFHILTKPEVNLKVDFAQQTWTLENVHKYDEQGNIILEENRYGLCAELSTFLYQKLRPMLPERFDLAFAQTAEAGFFPSHESSHIVLLLGDHDTDKFYIIDPSFHKYGEISDLNEYELLGSKKTLFFLESKSNHVSFLANQATPLLVKKDFLLSLAMVSIDGKFDQENFLLTISVVQRNNAPGRDILTVGKHRNQPQSHIDILFLQKILTQEEIDIMIQKLDNWLKSISP